MSPRHAGPKRPARLTPRAGSLASLAALAALALGSLSACSAAPSPSPSPSPSLSPSLSPKADASARGAASAAARAKAEVVASAPSAAAPEPGPPPLEPSSEEPTKRFDKPVRFLATGEQGRLAVLTVEDGALVPHRFEAGKWERLALPAAHRAVEGDPLGVYFGRDNRPRAMGYRREARKMLYLRFRDGRWQDQRSELGALAGDDAHLFGVLGEADPEVVCREGKLCLFKSRKGWQEAKPTIPSDAVVRVFGGRGYALTSTGVVRTGPSGFESVGPKATWTTPATGLWVSPEGHVVVVEPARSLVHELDAGASSWRSSAAPIVGPRDVLGPPERRLFVGDGGAARRERGRTVRVGPASLRLSRAIEVAERVVMGGESGVLELGSGVAR